MKKLSAALAATLCLAWASLGQSFKYNFATTNHDDTLTNIIGAIAGGRPATNIVWTVSSTNINVNTNGLILTPYIPLGVIETNLFSANAIAWITSLSRNFALLTSGNNQNATMVIDTGSQLYSTNLGKITADFSKSVNANTVIGGGVGGQLGQNTIGTNLPASDGLLPITSGPTFRYGNTIPRLSITNPIIEGVLSNQTSAFSLDLPGQVGAIQVNAGVVQVPGNVGINGQTAVHQGLGVDGGPFTVLGQQSELWGGVLVDTTTTGTLNSSNVFQVNATNAPPSMQVVSNGYTTFGTNQQLIVPVTGTVIAANGMSVPFGSSFFGSGAGLTNLYAAIAGLNGFGTNETFYGVTQLGTNEASGVTYFYPDGTERTTNSTTGYSKQWTNGQWLIWNGTNTSWFSNVVVTGLAALSGTITNRTSSFTFDFPGLVGALTYSAGTWQTPSSVNVGLNGGFSANHGASVSGGDLDVTGNIAITPFNSGAFYGLGSGLTNIPGTAINSIVAAATTATYVTGNNAILTNQTYSTNVVISPGTNAPTSQQTNYSITLLPGPSGNRLDITTGNTNVFLTLVNTNLSDYQRTVMLDARTNTISITIGFASPVITATNYTSTVQAGTIRVFNLYNLDTSGTNVLVSDMYAPSITMASILQPGPIVTNNESLSITHSNNVMIDVAHALYPSNSTPSRVAMIGADNTLTNAGATSAALPINRDGSATTFANVQSLAPGTIVTNGATQSTTVSNQFAVDQAHTFLGVFQERTNNTWQMANYALNNYDTFVLLSGAHTATMPDPTAVPGVTYWIQCASAGTNAILPHAAETFNGKNGTGLSKLTNTAVGNCTVLKSNGTNWWYSVNN